MKKLKKYFSSHVDDYDNVDDIGTVPIPQQHNIYSDPDYLKTFVLSFGAINLVIVAVGVILYFADRDSWDNVTNTYGDFNQNHSLFAEISTGVGLGIMAMLAYTLTYFTQTHLSNYRHQHQKVTTLAEIPSSSDLEMQPNQKSPPDSLLNKQNLERRYDSTDDNIPIRSFVTINKDRCCMEIECPPSPMMSGIFINYFGGRGHCLNTVFDWDDLGKFSAV